MYNEKVINEFRNPRNVGEIENYDAIGTVGNEVCGDIMQITLKIKDGVIVDAKFKTFGCTAAVASSSMATSMIIGKTIEEAKKSPIPTSSRLSADFPLKKYTVLFWRKKPLLLP